MVVNGFVEAEVLRADDIRIKGRHGKVPAVNARRTERQLDQRAIRQIFYRAVQ